MLPRSVSSCLRSSSVQKSLRGTASFSPSTSKADNLYTTSVEIPSEEDGQFHAFNAVYQDTKPSGSPVGTVVALHGSPGSHKDFKYITPLLIGHGIRFIGVNFPGFGHTPGFTHLKHDNRERVAFVQALIDKLELKERLVFMGHSRGTENALKMAALNIDRTEGAVLVNPTGLEIHQGIKPFWVLEFLDRMYDRGGISRALVTRFLYWYYHKIKLRVSTGEEAATCVKTMVNIALDKQKPFIDKLNQANGKVRALLTTAGEDHLVEPEISFPFGRAFKDCRQWTVKGLEGRKNDSELVQRFSEELSHGAVNVQVHFDDENHFLQKHRAHFIADAINAILRIPKSSV